MMNDSPYVTKIYFSKYSETLDLADLASLFKEKTEKNPLVENFEKYASFERREKFKLFQFLEGEIHEKGKKGIEGNQKEIVQLGFDALSLSKTNYENHVEITLILLEDPEFKSFIQKHSQEEKILTNEFFMNLKNYYIFKDNLPKIVKLINHLMNMVDDFDKFKKIFSVIDLSSTITDEKLIECVLIKATDDNPIPFFFIFLNENSFTPINFIEKNISALRIMLSHSFYLDAISKNDKIARELALISHFHQFNIEELKHIKLPENYIKFWKQYASITISHYEFLSKFGNNKYFLVDFSESEFPL